MAENNNISNILKGYAVSIVISLIVLFIYALILTNTSIQENTIKPTIIVITGVSTLIGSSISSMKIKKQGLVNGACVGGIYVLSLYILSSIVISGFSLNLSSIIMLIVGILLGCIGGIFGVNIGK